MALKIEKNKQEAARSNAGGFSAALRNAAQMIPAAQQQNATSSTQTVKMPTMSAAKQESSGTTVSMPSVRSAVANVIPIAQKTQTARQKMLYQQEAQPKWYSGDTPTRSEAQAQIYRISQVDPTKGRELFDAFQTFTADPSNPMYNPYTKATSNAVQELANLGYDLSGGFSQDWLDQNAALKNYYRTTTGTTPLAPSSSSTPEQDAAYWYYKAQNDEATTQKAETEWQALQDEIAYWTNRTDRNYSDDEILAKIDWKNYSTLTGMDEDAAKGTPTQLTRPVGYSQDALRGVIWATRNGVTTDDGNNSVRAALGQGSKWQENKEISQKLDPASEYYSPYSVSSTLDDAAIYFGVDSFDKDWLTENRDVLSSDDKTAKTMYTKVYNAEQTTLEAESELAELNKLIDKYCDRYDDSESVLKYLANAVDEDFQTLAKLDKGIASGSLVSTTRPIAYSWGDVRRTVQQRIDAKNNATPATQTMGKALGVTADENPTFDAITGAAKHNVQIAADLIEQSGTDAEKRKVLTAGTPEFDTLVQSVSRMMAKVKARVDKATQDQQQALYNMNRNTQAMNDAAAAGDALAQSTSGGNGYNGFMGKVVFGIPDEALTAGQTTPSIISSVDSMPASVNFGEIVAQTIQDKGKQKDYTSAANSAFAAVANRTDLTPVQRQTLYSIVQDMDFSTAETPTQTVSPYQESNLPESNKGIAGRAKNKPTATAEEAPVTDETAQSQNAQDSRITAEKPQETAIADDTAEQQGAEKNLRDSLPETTREQRRAKEIQKPEAESPELATARQEVLNALLNAQNAQTAQEYENAVRGALEDAIGIKSKEDMTLGEYASQPLQNVTEARNARNLEMLNIMNRQDEMYVADSYLGALEWIAPYQQADKERADLQAELDAMIARDPWIADNLNVEANYNQQYSPNDPAYAMQETLKEAQVLQKRINNVKDKMAGLEENYRKGESILENIGRKYQRSMQLSYIPGGKPMDTTMVGVLTYVYNYGANYQPTTWSAYSNIESALTNGENVATVAKYADDVETAAKQGIESIDAIIGYLDEKDVVLPNGDSTYINNLRRQQNLFQQELDGVEYWRLQQNADFAEVADAKRSEVADKVDYGTFTAWKYLDVMPDSVRGDISNLDAVLAVSTPGDPMTPGDANETGFNRASDTERQTYFYLLATQGREAANKYADYLNDTVLPMRNMEALTDFWNEVADEHPILATGASVLIAPAQIAGTLYSVAQAIRGEEINPYSRYFGASSVSSTIRSTTKENLDNAIDGWMGDSPAKGFVKWLASSSYDAVTSALDSSLNAMLVGNYLSGAVTDALTREGMSKGAQFAVRAFAGFAGASPMGLQAAGTAIQDVKFRGGSDEQALMIGLINFGAETITEAITLDNIQETFKAASADEAKGFLKTILHSALEEAPGEAINELVEGLGDDWIMGALSNHNLEIAEYERQGMTHEQAVQKAGFNFFLDCLNAGIVGGLSGSMSSSVSYAAGKAKNAYDNRQTRKARETAVHTAIEANEQAQQTTEAPAEQQTAQEEIPAETVQTDEQDNEEKLTRIAALGNVDLIQDTSMQTAIIANSLLNAEGTNLDVASATAETLAFATSPQEAANTVSDLLTVASTENVRMNDVQEALANAVLGNGQAAQAFDTIKRDGVSKETMHALMEASAQDRVNQQVQDEVAGMVRENAIASEVVRMIGDGALNGLRTYEAAVNKAQTALTNAQEAAQQFAERAKAAGENLQKVNNQFIADAANAALAGMVEQATKEVQSIAVQRQQAETTLRTRQEELRAARETLKVAQEDALSRVRQEATQTVTEAAAAAQQEEAARRQATAQEAVQRAIQGLNGTLYTTDNTPINFHYALVDPSSLLVSNDAQNGAVNPAYPAELQPRDRTRAESVQTTQERARNLNPERLGESVSAQEGAPVIGADGVVESGNGRVMAIQQAMQNNSERAKAYTDFLRKNATKYGIDPNSITDKSILVRVRDTDVDRVAFARQANESQTSTFSDTETARQDAAKLNGEILATYNANSENINSKGNSDFVTRFLDKVIPASEKGKYMQADGKVSQQFITRVRNALFEKAYGSSLLTNALAESTDENVKNIINALTAEAPLVATTTQQIAEGKLNALDPAQAIAQAAEAYRRVKASGQSVAEYTNQLTIPGFETESEGAKALMQFFEENGKSTKKLKEGIKGIYDLLRSYGNPNQQSFLDGGNVPANVDALIQQGLKESQRDLLNSANGIRPFIGKGNAAEITQQLRNNNKVISGDQLLNTLEQLTGIPIDKRKRKYLRELRPITEGYSSPKAGTTHVKDANDVGTAMHEYGHVLDEQFGLSKQIGNEAINSMVAKMRNNALGLDVEAYSESELRSEAVAELMRRWFFSREVGVMFGGEAAVKILENELNKQGWLQGFQEASQAFKLNRSSTDTDRAIGSIMLDPPKAVQQKYERGWAGFERKMSDHAVPLRQIAENQKAAEKAEGKEHDYAHDVYVQERMRVSTTRGLTDSCLNGNGLVDKTGNLVLDENGNSYGNWADIFKGIELKDEGKFAAYWAALDALDRQDADHMGKMGIKEVFGKDIDPEQVVREVEAEHPEWRSIIEKAERWWEAFEMTWVINEHLTDMDALTYRAMRDFYKFYLPTYRAGRNGENHSGKGLTTEADPGNTIFKRAVGGTEMIYNPVMGFVEKMQNTIAAAKRVELFRTLNWNFRNGYTELGMIEDAQPDLTVTSNREANQNAREALKEALQQLRHGKNKITPEAQKILQQSLEMLPSQTFTEEETASGGDVLNFRDENGDMVRLTIYNKPLFEALQDMRPIQQNALMTGLRALTNFLAANATSRKAKFIIQNMSGDVETAINTGKGSMLARNYPVYWVKEFTAGIKVLQNEINAHRKNGNVSQEYADFGIFGHLQSKMSLRETKTQKQIRESIYGKNKGLDAAKVANKTKAIIAAPITSQETLADLLENTTRFNEFGLAKTKEEKERGYSTYSDKLRRGMNAHEATTDFSMYGTSKSLQWLKVAVPFLNASVQGTFKTINTFGKMNAGHRASILARQAVNCVLMNMLWAAIKNATWSDEEKEGWEEVSDYEKNKYWHFKIDGDLAKYFGSDFLKLKRSQDGFIAAADALGMFLGDTLTGYEGDALGNLMGALNEIVMNMIPNHNLSTQGFVDGLNNTTYYGASITNYYDDKMPATERYDSDTTPWARGISTMLSGFGVDLSPKQVDYIVQQYTGSLGQIGGDLIVAATDGKLNGETMLEIFNDRILTGFTYDPVKQNQLTSKFYDNCTMFEQITAEAGQNGTTSLLRSDLTTEEQKAAVEEARAMMKKGGIMQDTKDEISTIYDKIDEILANETMSSYDKTKACDELYAQRNKLCIAANIAAGDYLNKYGYNNNAVRAFHNMSILIGLESKAPYEAATDYDLMPDVFKEAADTREMKFAQAAWEASAEDPSARKSTLLPHPQTSFTKDKTKYDMEGAGQEAYNEAYWNAYSDYLTDKPLEATDDPDKQEEWLNAAHKKGMAAGQAAYLEWLAKQQ